MSVLFQWSGTLSLSGWASIAWRTCMIACIPLAQQSGLLRTFLFSPKDSQTSLDRNLTIPTYVPRYILHTYMCTYLPAFDLIVSSSLECAYGLSGCSTQAKTWYDINKWMILPTVISSFFLLHTSTTITQQTHGTTSTGLGLVSRWASALILSVSTSL